MSKNEQVLIIEPQNELRFRGPFNVPVTSYMKLSNPTDKKVLFKIKTTAPKKYCVRPNSGVLEPKGNLEIAICLQPFIFDPAEKNKHKFMVQTVIAAEDANLNFEQQWKEITPENLMDTKLKCVFELPVDQNDTNNQEEPAVKASPKAPVQQAAPPNINSVEVELQKAAAEVQYLREEESSLRQENLRLKEEILRLKHSTGVAVPPLNKYTPVVQPAPMSMMYMAVGVGLALLGIILGKFVL